MIKVDRRPFAKLILIALVLCLLALSGCGAEKSPTSGQRAEDAVRPSSQGQAASEQDNALREASISFFAMDTFMEIRAFGADDALLASVEEAVEDLEKRISVTVPGSEISVLNNEGRAALSEVPARMLKRGLELCDITSGRLDLSIYPVVRAWGFTTGEHRIPQQTELSALLEKVDYTKISLSGSEASVEEGMEIDLGSVGKGFAADLISGMLTEGGVKSALINLGGNVQTIGAKPDGSLWKIAVQDPRSAGIIGVVETEGQAVVTSGGYERYFEGEDGTVYWHIMDPETGAPARSGLISATAIGSEGMYCDALSTALFVMGEEEALSFWKERGDFEMILVTDDGRMLASAGLRGRFSAQPGSGYELQFIGEGK